MVALRLIPCSRLSHLPQDEEVEESIDKHEATNDLAHDAQTKAQGTHTDSYTPPTQKNKQGQMMVVVVQTFPNLCNH